MAHTASLTSNSYSGATEPRASIHDLIRPNLRRAFPLPTAEPVDDKFRRLLEALAQHSGRSPQTAPAAQPSQGTTFDDWVLVTMLVGTAVGGVAAVIGGAYGLSVLLTFWT